MAFREVKSSGRVGDHGGSLAQARSLFPGAPEPFVDLSTGINPHSYPVFDLPATAFSRLPEPARLDELRGAAARAYGAPSSRNVVAAPGTQILLPRVYGLVAPGSAMVLGPTYAEHARTARIAGHSVTETSDFSLLAQADLAIVVNPNNPDGRLVRRAELGALAATMAAKGGLLVVDEAFMDGGDGAESMAAEAGRPGVVVLRSFGKFFGLAGVRLGFAIAEPGIVERLDAEFGPWAVSGPALEYGIRALGDRKWQEDMRAGLTAGAERLDGLLARSGLDVAGGTPLFRLLHTPHAKGLYSALGGEGIILRRFAWSADALRVGLPGAEAEWQRLEAALDLWQKNCREEALR